MHFLDKLMKNLTIVVIIDIRRKGLDLAKKQIDIGNPSFFKQFSWPTHGLHKIIQFQGLSYGENFEAL